MSVERKENWSEDRALWFFVQWGHEDKPRRLRGSGGEVSQGCVESGNQGEEVSPAGNNSLTLHQMRRLPISFRFSYLEVTVTLMRAVIGKWRGTRLIWVGSRIYARDTILGENFHWEVCLWTLRFYILILFTQEEVLVCEEWLKGHKLPEFPNVQKPLEKVWCWQRLRSSQVNFPMSFWPPVALWVKMAVIICVWAILSGHPWLRYQES